MGGTHFQKADALSLRPSVKGFAAFTEQGLGHLWILFFAVRGQPTNSPRPMVIWAFCTISVIFQKTDKESAMRVRVHSPGSTNNGATS